MKKLCLLIIALALLLSACVYRLPQGTQGSSDPAFQGTESMPSSSDTSPTYESIEYSMPTGTITNSQEGDTITVGPYTFKYGSDSRSGELIYGWMLISCEDYVEKAVIPDELYGFPVIGIGRKAGGDHPFGKETALKSIIIPDTVVYISFRAFQNCTSLAEIKLSCNIKTLGEPGINSDDTNYLFGDSVITFLDVPEGIERLNHHVFAESSLENVILPLSLTVVES